ncbi:hypothetical protein RJT34_28118 [Clitoria ternatea]|uniref:Uncharacterized protein n=1 Tax=Clitoria ternatea TaxID=43366 RepID=A0AAN9ICE2_CLITE
MPTHRKGDGGHITMKKHAMDFEGMREKTTLEVEKRHEGKKRQGEGSKVRVHTKRVQIREKNAAKENCKVCMKWRETQEIEIELEESGVRR